LQLLYIVLISIFVTACSVHKDKNSLTLQTSSSFEKVSDLEHIPQDVSFYSNGINKKALSLEDFQSNYFRTWNIEKISIDLKDAMWPHEAFKYGNSYGENLQLLSEEFFDKVLKNSNFSEYATLNQRALSLNLLNLRAFPTDKPLLRDPKKAGEGFPFDYMQNSSVAANKPLFVSHYSKDKEWAFVESSFAFGWVKSKDIVFIEKKYTDIWQNAEQIFITSDDIAIYSASGDFLFKSRVGMMLALIKENRDSYTVLTVSKGENLEPLYLHSEILKKDAHKGTLAFNAKNINRVLSGLAFSNYGWGGMYGQRDCSSTLRDLYAPFGLWLPRNSSKQAQAGDILSLDGLSDTEKISLIKSEAKPFETLLYKQGHIVLYVGVFEDEIVVFQNVWGVKTQKDGDEGRYVVGRSIFSTLELGKNLKDYDQNASLLRNLQSLNSLM